MHVTSMMCELESLQSSSPSLEWWLGYYVVVGLIRLDLAGGKEYWWRIECFSVKATRAVGDFPAAKVGYLDLARLKID